MEGHISYHKYLLSDDMPITFKNTPDLKCIAKATTCSTYQLQLLKERQKLSFPHSIETCSSIISGLEYKFNIQDHLSCVSFFHSK
jgi:hypothetical protein